MRWTSSLRTKPRPKQPWQSVMQSVLDVMCGGVRVAESEIGIDGDVAIVGARTEDGNGTDAGAAYVFQRNGTSWT